MNNTEWKVLLKERLFFYARLSGMEDEVAKKALEEAFCSADNPEGVFDALRFVFSQAGNDQSLLSQWIEKELSQLFDFKGHGFCFDTAFSKPLVTAMLPIKRKSMTARISLEPDRFLKLVGFFSRLRKKTA
ncbi:hypothetical protein [Methylacidiphilum caldifontis]|uniref:Uncharacterized protein n=1 Tax=Methylacidiphilum caldifontis TaxID=2795386 RepID=A0A4Y8PHD3_9BACT|nr:hypothetical protein [Methylacidiphilum caldifontis]TFE72065.1 hypothetical protein A7Q10_03915 [Methylacidiphilum caldifontis]